MIDFTPIFKRLGLLDDEPEDFTVYRQPLAPDSADVVIARINGREAPDAPIKPPPRRYRLGLGKKMTGSWVFSRGISSAKFSVIKPLLEQGLPDSAISEQAKANRRTVARYRKFWETEHKSKLMCLCGREAGHNGWCPARLSRSVARQNFLRQRWGRLKSAI
jgi:hypothetical protein